MSNKSHSRHRRHHYDQYSAFDPNKHASAVQRRKMWSRIILFVVSIIAIIVVCVALWAYTH